MSKITVTITEKSSGGRYAFLSYLGHKTIIEFDEIDSVQDLSAAFLRVAHSAGFSYVREVELVTQTEAEEEESEQQERERSTLWSEAEGEEEEGEEGLCTVLAQCESRLAAGTVKTFIAFVEPEEAGQQAIFTTDLGGWVGERVEVTVRVLPQRAEAEVGQDVLF